MSLINEQEKNIVLQRVNPEKCYPWKYADRTELESKESVEVIAESIKNNGQIQPAVVIPNKSKNIFDKSDTSPDYFIIAGQQRWRAAKLAGVDLEVIVKNIEDENQLIKLMYDENEKRNEIHPISRGKLFIRMMEEKGLEQQDIANFFSINKSMVSRFLGIVKKLDSIEFYEFNYSSLRSLLDFINSNNLESYKDIPNIDKILKNKLSITELNSELQKSKSILLNKERKTRGKNSSYIYFPFGTGSKNKDFIFRYNDEKMIIELNSRIKSKINITEDKLKRILEIVNE